MAGDLLIPIHKEHLRKQIVCTNKARLHTSPFFLFVRWWTFTYLRGIEKIQIAIWERNQNVKQHVRRHK